MRKILIAITLILVGWHKDYFDYGSAVFSNESNNEVVLLRNYISYQYYPKYDTILDNCVSEKCRFIKVAPNSKQTILYWTNVDKLYKTDTISVFVLDKITFDTVSWKNICNDYLIICRYDLSGRNLEELNSVIPYPPSPAMKDMKMFPSYEEIINKEQK